MVGQRIGSVLPPGYCSASTCSFYKNWFPGLARASGFPLTFFWCWQVMPGWPTPPCRSFGPGTVKTIVYGFLSFPLCQPPAFQVDRTPIVALFSSPRAVCWCFCVAVLVLSVSSYCSIFFVPAWSPFPHGPRGAERPYGVRRIREETWLFCYRRRGGGAGGLAFFLKVQGCHSRSTNHLPRLFFPQIPVKMGAVSHGSFTQSRTQGKGGCPDLLSPPLFPFYRWGTTPVS